MTGLNTCKNWPPYLDLPKPEVISDSYREYYKVLDETDDMYCSMPGISCCGFATTEFNSIDEAKSVKESLELNDQDRAEHIVNAVFTPHTYKIFKFKETLHLVKEEI